MILSEQAFNELLPPYLQDTSKGRIRNALSQFSREGTIDYDGFYIVEGPDYLLQADVFSSVKGIMWNETSGEVENGYNPAMLISNSCDVSEENIRSINQKDVLFAPIIPLDEYVADCKSDGFSASQIETFSAVLKKQEYTNLFYLPPNPINHQEYFVRLDRMYWVPTSQLAATIKDINASRFISLSQWGWYLFAVKLSLHTSRVPETIERPQN